MYVVVPCVGDPHIYAPTPRRLRPGSARPGQDQAKEEMPERYAFLEEKVGQLERTLENMVLSMTVITRASLSSQTATHMNVCTDLAAEGSLAAAEASLTASNSKGAPSGKTPISVLLPYGRTHARATDLPRHVCLDNSERAPPPLCGRQVIAADFTPASEPARGWTSRAA
mmetsp:Transcript_24098/g.61584  ORF Transcript_24098/g.61584 Transcript_24098/m.61584 type:complete len:170 (-) Transcript_24098:504-1013(-)